MHKNTLLAGIPSRSLQRSPDPLAISKGRALKRTGIKLCTGKCTGESKWEEGKGYRGGGETLSLQIEIMGNL